MILSDPAVPNPTFAAPAQIGAVLTFSLMVTDTAGLASLSTDTVTITVDRMCLFLPLALK